MGGKIFVWLLPTLFLGTVSLADAQNPPKFAPCTAAEHTYEMFQRSYGYAPSASQRSM